MNEWREQNGNFGDFIKKIYDDFHVDGDFL